ncbi:hypothetical protein [Actinomadura sp. HBU206391]|uniref:hypothetical protein n=1 Tax=Actinomadura sp. HBU206391 TaxID=2731692 RepID=UPI00165057C5|nr:hypothetical protein [Actinomadura sp. HBU206391]MBC6458241.1 hypothetical protein [Actinomadura sp. HBU206391]
MNEMQMLRDHRDSRPDTTPASVTQARARLTAHARSESARTRRPALSHGRRYVLAAVGVAGAAMAALIAPAVLGGGHSDQAYAVERLPDGKIKVTLREFTDSAALQRRLNAMGVRAVVTYLPRDARCTEPRAALVDGPQPLVVDHRNPFPPHPGRVRLGDLTFYIHPDRIGPGQTLVWTMNYDRDLRFRNRAFAFSTNAYLARGPVRPCEPIMSDSHPPIRTPR